MLDSCWKVAPEGDRHWRTLEAVGVLEGEEAGTSPFGVVMPEDEG